MVYWLGFIYIYLLSIVSVVQVGVGQLTPDTIKLRFTVRSFITSWCMPEVEYHAAWGNLPPPEDTNLPSNTINGIPNTELVNNVNSRSCKYFQQIRDGLISGHMFFEAIHYGNCAACEIPDMFSMYDTERLNKSSSGLNKPIACFYSGTCEEFFEDIDPFHFESLFFDTYKYSRRSGFELTLFFDEERGVYRYNSQLPQHEENAQFNLGVDFDLFEPYVNRTSYDDFVEGLPDIDQIMVPERYFGPLDRFVQDYGPYYVTEEDNVNPFTSFLPAWPQTKYSAKPPGVSYSLDNRVARSHDHQFWTTLELHIVFQYKGGEIFNFNVQDLAFVYVDGKQVLQVVGYDKPKGALLELDSLGLEIGEIYTLDAFQSDYHSGGCTFLFETTLLEVCNVVRSGRKVEALTIMHNDNVQVVPTAGPGGDYSTQEITLLSSSTQLVSNYAFFESQINVGTGFILEFTFTATGNTDGGFAVLIHRRELGLTSLPTSGNSQLGFKNYENSVAIAFDFCPERETFGPNLHLEERLIHPYDNNLDDMFGAVSCRTQHVRIHYNANGGLNPNGVNAESLHTHDLLWNNMSTGAEHQVSIEYLETPPHLNVYIDGSLYLREENFNLDDIIGGRNAYVGFTSAQSLSLGEIKVKDILIRSVDIEPRSTTATEDSYENITKKILANDFDVAEFVFVTRDECGNRIEFGGDTTSFNAQLVKRNTTELASGSVGFPQWFIVEEEAPEVVDKNDGSYGVQVKTREITEYGLFVAHGKNCSNFDTLDLDNLQNTTGCFYYFNENAIDALKPPNNNQGLLGNKTDYIVLYTSVVGGFFLCVLLVVGVFFRRYKEKWDKDKHLVLIGQNERLNREQNFATNEVMDDLAKKNERLAAQVLQERAKEYDKTGQYQAVDNLRSENMKLAEELNKMQYKKETGDLAAQNALFEYENETYNINNRPKRTTNRKVFDDV